jgi:hypothetical protein
MTIFAFFLLTFPTRDSLLSFGWDTQVSLLQANENGALFQGINSQTQVGLDSTSMYGPVRWPASRSDHTGCSHR